MLEHLLPGLRTTNYAVTSPVTPTYNCIGWAAGDSKRWWWPSQFAYWPADVPREETLTAFVAAFATLGYATCQDEQKESGFEKVAIFVNSAGKPTHAARQLGSGMWTSKLGKGYDIAHELNGVCGRAYGRVALILIRSR